MAQFDVYHNTNQATRRRTPYVLDVQAEVMSILPTRLVCPIRRLAEIPLEPVERIHIPVTIDNQECIVFVSELTAVAVSLLGARAQSLQSRRQEIIAAVDLLITGF